MSIANEPHAFNVKSSIELLQTFGTNFEKNVRINLFHQKDRNFRNSFSFAFVS